MTTQLIIPREVSSYTYPKEYRGPKPIGEQVDMIAQAFDLSRDYTSDYIEKVLPTHMLPEGAEGLFAIPSVEAIAKRHFPQVTGQTEKYCYAVEFIFEKLWHSRPFYNYRKGEITPLHLRQHARTLYALNLIAQQQKGDIWIIPAQLGFRHRGRSVLLARECFIGAERSSENLIPGDEFGLDTFAVGSIAFTHPERYVRRKELCTDCAGDEFARDAVGVFSESPLFHWDDDRLWFGTGCVSDAEGDCGSVSGFVPQG